MKSFLSAIDINVRQANNAKSLLCAVLMLLIGVSTATAQDSTDNTTASPSAGCPTAKRPLDYDGDGRTDASVARNTGGGTNGQVTSYTRNSATGSLTATSFGLASDNIVSGDFDGDGKADITVWRSGTQAFYYILQSQTNTFRADAFGQTGDDPTVVGDYDGDGKTDPAIYRPGAAAGNPSIWAYRASTGAQTGQIIIVQWGQNGDFPAPGDFDGDGRYDLAVQRGTSGGQAAFYIRQSTAGNTAFTFGLPTDLIVPGYYDNDCKTDIAVVRSSGGARNWYIRNSTNGALQAYNFGTAGTDLTVQGDYDGDGATDIAVWRPSATAGQTTVYGRRSMDGALGVKQWGQTGDFPVARFNSH